MRELEEIIEDFENTRTSFRNYRSKKEMNKDTLIEYEHRFLDLSSELRPIKANLLGEWIKRDDKASTAIKGRITVAIHEGEFKDEEGNLIYDECSINQAEKFAAGAQKYKEFLSQRSFYKESYTNVADLRNDCSGYVNLIKDILKTIQ